MTEISIEGGRTLVDHEIFEESVHTAGREIRSLGFSPCHSSLSIDARGLLVLPGIVDLHGDAFERQFMPRAGVNFPGDVALMESDRQVIANGITTAFYATTWSWEPGLRSGDNARAMLEMIETMRPRLAADTRFHFRHETYNLDAESEIVSWMAKGRIDLFAFNDHMTGTVADLAKPQKRNRMIERTGLNGRDFDDLVGRVVSRALDVPDSIDRLCNAARLADIRMLSHDDESPAVRARFRARGVRIAEFPINEATAREAAEAGDFIVFGAPNVVRGGSHTGWTNASEMIAKGLCSVLASDYYYPAQLLAAFSLANDKILPLSKAWNLISSAPARAARLDDRGVIAEGYRADIILVDDRNPVRPSVVAVLAAGRLVHLTDAGRLRLASTAPRKKFSPHE